MLGLRGRALPNTALAMVGLVGDRISATAPSDIAKDPDEAREKDKPSCKEVKESGRRRKQRKALLRAFCATGHGDDTGSRKRTSVNERGTRLWQCVTVAA